MHWKKHQQKNRTKLTVEEKKIERSKRIQRSCNTLTFEEIYVNNLRYKKAYEIHVANIKRWFSTQNNVSLWYNDELPLFDILFDGKYALLEPY